MIARRCPLLRLIAMARGRYQPENATIPRGFDEMSACAWLGLWPERYVALLRLSRKKRIEVLRLSLNLFSLMLHYSLDLLSKMRFKISYAIAAFPSLPLHSFAPVRCLYFASNIWHAICCDSVQIVCFA